MNCPVGRTLIALTAVIALASGCASVQEAPSSADRAAKSFKPPAGKSSIYVFRESAFAGKGVAVPVSVDGRLVGTVGSGTFARVNVEPGNHVVASYTAESGPALNVPTEAGGNYFVELETHFGMTAARATLRRVGDAEGRKGVLGCRLILGPD
ncbi:MAG TPA: DUF2846 domain-containing protein [Verrucomicrobiae bacterium]|nr:DUF2846 domain-containing protein [Verrucomicrobiae bacterium]